MPCRPTVPGDKRNDMIGLIAWKKSFWIGRKRKRTPLPRNYDLGYPGKARDRLSRDRTEGTRKKVVAVEVIIREFFRWLDGKQDQGRVNQEPVRRGKESMRRGRSVFRGRIRWVLSDKEKSWIPFKLLLMVGVLERQIWSYSEKDRKITKRIPKSNMYFNGPSQERQRILQLWMLQKLMDLFEVEQESRISQWESFLCIQGIEMANHEEVMFLATYP